MAARFQKAIVAAAAVWILAATPLPTCAVEAELSAASALARYVAAPDPSYGWKLRMRGEVQGSEYLELILTSQQWQGLSWRHQLFIVRPDNLDTSSRQGVLLISGGRWRDSYDAPPADRPLPASAGVYLELARALRAPLAILRQVPFQPIFEGLTEDEAIAYSFERFLESGDPHWPLLLPMVKSAVRAMDAVQAAARESWSVDLERFVVVGASKRGWTTWLTGAVDPRVSAIAPMVIDIVRFEPQLTLARDTWGTASEQLEPYTRRGIDAQLDSPRGQTLLEIVDPWRYRALLTRPKLVINATNDRYWPVDAASVYWDGLPGEKHLLYVPNQGHGVRDFSRLIGGVVALHRATNGGPPMPQLDWQFEEDPDRILLSVGSTAQPSTMQAWIASSASRDFRSASWRPLRMPRHGERYRIAVDRARQQYVALFGEAIYRKDRSPPLHLSTGVRIFPPGPAAPQ